MKKIECDIHVAHLDNELAACTLARIADVHRNAFSDWKKKVHDGKSVDAVSLKMAEFKLFLESRQRSAMQFAVFGRFGNEKKLRPILPYVDFRYSNFSVMKKIREAISEIAVQIKLVSRSSGRGKVRRRR